MTRRSLLKKICTLISLCWIGVISLPIFEYILSPLRKKKYEAKKYRLVRLNQLKANSPQLFNIVSDHRDAWMVYPNETVGRVWVNRVSKIEENPQETKLEVFSAICPHLGCTIQLDSDKKYMICPCHKGMFELDGQPVPNSQLGYKNPTPRGMDSLNYEIVQEEDSEDWWVTVEYQKFKLGPTTKIPLT